MAPTRPPADSSSNSSRRVLVLGGAGYVGQFVVVHLASQPNCAVYASYHSTAPAADMDGVTWVRVDISNKATIDSVLEDVKPHVVVNCIAISAVKVCEDNPELALAVNCPVALLDSMREKCSDAWLIHMSTDLVYDGGEAPYVEGAAAGPLNMYAKVKYQFDEAIAASSVQAVVLRSSNILGPPAPMIPTPSKFLQWLHGQLKNDAPCKLFVDELRSYISVRDVVRYIAFWVFHQPMETTGKQTNLFHMGGPASHSRVDVGRAVLAAGGLDDTYLVYNSSSHHDRYSVFSSRKIQPIPRNSVPGLTLAPLDATMDSTALYKITGTEPMSLLDIVRDGLLVEAASDHK